jgi:acyl-CoA synthetase (AMP-forming)/AMP-acid ligase II
MTKFIEQLEKNCVNFSERLAIALDYKNEAITYGELWNLSGKVYAYLKNHNIGKEDFVLINLPRGSKFPLP